MCVCVCVQEPLLCSEINSNKACHPLVSEYQAQGNSFALAPSVAMLRPPRLNFGAFVAERDRCRDRTYVSDDPILRKGFFCNTNRMWDTVSQELAYATGVGPLYRQEAIATIIVLRMSGSPRNDQLMSGSEAIMKQAIKGRYSFAKFVETMRFSRRKTYRAVVKKQALAKSVWQIAKRVNKKVKAKSLASLQNRIMRYFSEETGQNRKVKFHSLQIACDLHSLSYVRVKDRSDCPLTTGSERGMKHVRRWECPDATVKGLAETLGRPAHTIQTSLCEFDKYTRWSNGEK